jgi:hypothetical protein
MRGFKTLNYLVAFVLVAAVGVSAQDVNLRYLPDDTMFAVGLDFQKLMSILPEEMKAEMFKDADAFAVELVGKIDYFLMSIPAGMMQQDMEGFYGLMVGDITADQFVQIARKKGEVISEEQVGSLKAYYKEEGTSGKMYIAQAAPGMLVIGSKSGLEKYQAVASGQQPNITTVPDVNDILGVIDTKSLLFMAGILPEQLTSMMAAQNPAFADLKGVGLDANYANHFLDLRVAVTSDNPDALDALKSLMEEQLSMMTQMDPTGMLSEFVDNMKFNIQGNMMIVTTGISGETIKKAIEQFGEMFKGMIGAEEKQE